MGLTVTEREVAIRLVTKEANAQKAAAMVAGKADVELAKAKAIDYVRSPEILKKLEVLANYVTRVEELQAEAVEYGRVMFEELNALADSQEAYTNGGSYYSGYTVNSAATAKSRINGKIDSCIEQAKRKFFDATPTGQKVVFLDKVADDAASRIMLCTANDKLVNALKSMMAMLGVTYDI